MRVQLDPADMLRSRNALLGIVATKTRGAGRRLMCHLTASSRRLPDWLIIGAQKAGTTSLYDYIVRHPDVRGAVRKEVHFFDNAFHRGALWYRSFFPLEREVSRHQATTGRRLQSGEATPYYLFHPLVPRRAARVVPGVRLIVLLRNPVNRAFSHYTHEKVRGHEPLSFEEAIAAEPGRIHGEEKRMVLKQTSRSRKHQVFSYVARGFYAQQLRRWMEYFPDDQILVLGSERFYADPQATMAEVFAFLGLQPYGLPEFNVRNPGQYSSRLPAAAAAQLREIYWEPNEELFEMTGTDFGWNEVRCAP